MKVISLGWGVQSFTLAAMAALGEIDPVDYAIHADTGYESSLTYEFANIWTNWLVNYNVPIVTVKEPNVQIVIKRGGGKIYIPAFTETVERSSGMLRRQCTGKWKVAPIRRFIQQKRGKQNVTMLIGISLDEFQRIRKSDVKYIENEYPLIDKRMTRNDCVNWLQKNNLQVPPKSACYFCPFHTTSEWRKIAASSDWVKACAVDREIRYARPKNLGLKLYLHPSLQPLEKVDFRSAEEKGQMTLWDNECSGMCGV